MHGYPIPRQCNKTYNIICPGRSRDVVENYLLISIDGAGFIVIREEISIY